MAVITVLGGIGQEALLVFITRNGASWDPGWLVHILFEVGLGDMGGAWSQT